MQSNWILVKIEVQTAMPAMHIEITAGHTKKSAFRILLLTDAFDV